MCAQGLEQTLAFQEKLLEEEEEMLRKEEEGLKEEARELENLIERNDFLDGEITLGKANMEKDKEVSK